MILDFFKHSLSNIYWLMAISIIGSFCASLYIIPKIIYMVNHHNLNEKPGHRSSHTKATPSMGGLAFFVAMILNLFLLKNIDVDTIGLNLAAALTIIFIIGLKDDLTVTTPKARILIEILAVLIIFSHSGFHCFSFDGFLGVNELPHIIIDVFHLFIILAIINAYNLIDGVDGLASTVGITIFSMFGLIFFSIGLYYYTILCLGIISMLAAFLRYNFSHDKKIFMGDTGSLLIGFLMAFLSLKFLTLQPETLLVLNIKPENKLFVLAALLVVPLFDLLRVVAVRIMHKENPFKADKNHVHHILLEMGWPHYKIALVLGLLNYCLAILIILLADYLKSFQMLVVLTFIFALFIVFFYKLKQNTTLKQPLNPISTKP